MNIIQTLIDKGIDIGTSLIPGGSLAKDCIKSLAKSWLGNENATEEEVEVAIKNATPEDLESIKLIIQQKMVEVDIEAHKTTQSQEKTAQNQISLREKMILTFGKILEKHCLAFVIYMTILFLSCIGGIAFCEFKMITPENIEKYTSIESFIIGLLTLVLFAPISMMYEPIGKVMDALSRVVCHGLSIRITFDK